MQAVPGPAGLLHPPKGQCFDVLALWRERATQVAGNSLPCGHYIAEEAPELLMTQVLKFFMHEGQHHE